ncbi:hypothetical protein K2173_020317 [Erythroxylum novogranatense]|uniref:Uncharacterized protein n=1 Tax=Erythroxylum novogranatense TaxID=1862640 RepID=A0AAV8UAH8_9ROSI|nr:hypothetical protein K2173_020317 [Erythroxylum novogranatense]
MSQPTLFVSGSDTGNLAVSSGLVHQSWNAIGSLYSEVNSQNQALRWRVVEESNQILIAFVTSPVWTRQHLQQDGDLVSLQTLKQENFAQFDFLIPANNSSVSIHRAAITLFRSHVDELIKLIDKYYDSTARKWWLKTPLVITGHALGGSIASLFTLLLLDFLNQISTEHTLLCVTFGSPLLGDTGLQQVISECERWKACFLHVVANKDYLPRLFMTHTNLPYKPFGTFLLCSESGSTCADDPSAVLELLKATGLESTNQASNGDLPLDYYGNRVKDLESRVKLEGNSRLRVSTVDPLLAGISLQLEVFGDDSVLQQQNQTSDLDNLIKKLKERETACWLKKRKDMNPKKKLNDVKVKMTYMGQYKMKYKRSDMGYYDIYKNMQFNVDIDIARYKKFLEIYWKDIVEKAEKVPYKVMARIRTGHLYAGTNYRRMVEPLDIAEFYRESGRRDYEKNGRSKHYILLEKWAQDDPDRDGTATNPPSDEKKKKIADMLTEDSCFWAKVEEAIISCKLLKDSTSSDQEKQSSMEYLKWFEEYVMKQINNYAVSTEIFLEQSSFMKTWWEEFQQVMEPTHSSPIVEFMKNGRYRQYKNGSY